MTGATRAADQPRRGVDALRGETERQAREESARVLAEIDRNGHVPIGGSTSGPDQRFWFDYRPRGVEIRVFTCEAIASQEAWHTYWRANSDGHGYRTQDEVLRAAAPAEPFSDVAFAVHLTWGQVRGWLAEPAQLDLLSVLEETT